jgi:hypothetical protein
VGRRALPLITTNSSRGNFGEPTYSNKLTLTAHHPKKSLDLNTLSTPPNTCLVETVTINCTKPNISTLRRDSTHIKFGGRCPEHLMNSEETHSSPLQGIIYTIYTIYNIYYREWKLYI